jgi:hypothetical protein
MFRGHIAVLFGVLINASISFSAAGTESSAQLVLLAQETAIDFGDDDGPFALDGSCGDPRFDGPGMSPTPLIEEDIFHDATDCREASAAGSIKLLDRSTAFVGPSLSGTWVIRQNAGLFFTLEGELEFPGISHGPVRATYFSGTSTGTESGELFGELEGTVLTGEWTRQGGSTRCTTGVHGSSMWGRFRFEFNQDMSEFTGLHGVCDGPLDRSWNGELFPD